MNQAVTPHKAFARQVKTHLRGEVAKMLPDDVSTERFERIVISAVARNPELLEADRASLFLACVDAAQDGLLPDGREGALVIYNSKQKDGTFKKLVRWMPMIGGLYKKLRESGQIATICADIVYQGDFFEWERGDQERLVHQPAVFEPNRGSILGAYAIVTFRDGNVEREVMSTGEIEDVRKVSRAGSGGSWGTWWGEMAKKTVIRRLSKRLPLSAEARIAIERDDDMYDLDGPREIPDHAPPRPKRVDFLPAAQSDDDVTNEAEEESAAMDQQHRETIREDAGKATEPGPEPDPAPQGSPPEDAPGEATEPEATSAAPAKGKKPTSPTQATAETVPNPAQDAAGYVHWFVGRLDGVLNKIDAQTFWGSQVNHRGLLSAADHEVVDRAYVKTIAKFVV